MEITAMMLMIVCPLVFLAGFVDAIAGGGGLIALPAYLLAGVPAHVAIGTNKLSSSAGSILAVIRFFRNGFINGTLVFFCIICALCGSLIGSQLSLLVSEAFIRMLLIPVLPVVAFYVLRSKDWEAASHTEEISVKKQYLITMVSSFIIGGYDGFYGPGTGTFLILVYTGLAKMDVKTASGNGRAVNLASNLSALAVFLLHGKVMLVLGIPAAICSMAGNYFGSSMVLKNGSQMVRPMILTVLVLLFAKLVFQM